MDEDIAVVNDRAEIEALPPDTTMLKGNDLSDADLVGLGKLPELTTLYLDGCMRLGDLALSRIARLPFLSVLYISGEGITDDGLKHLAKNQGLRELGLDAPVTGEGFRHLTELPDLNELHLPACPGMTPEGVAAIATLPELRTLCFYGCRTMDDSWLEALHDAKTVFRLRMTGCPGVTDEGIEALATALPDCTVTRS